MELVTITIDGRQIQAERGTRLLDVAEENGIYIPHLCYYKGLSVYGGCRICVVEIEGQRGQPLSCTTYVNDGMVVRTSTPALWETRRAVIELIQADHPGRCFDCFRTTHCPPGWICLRDEVVTERCLTCAKNGRCELQTTTEAIGLRGQQRFSGEKQFWYQRQSYSPGRRDNPFIEFEWSKCILCTRCVRVCEEVRGRGVYTLAFRGGQARVNTAFELPLQDTNCEFCGACIDVCPTCAIMDRQSKWAGLPDQQVATICPYCGVGCTMILDIKDGRIIRSVPDPNSPVNKGQDCVKGRWGLDFVHDPRRLTTPLIKRDGQFVEATWEEALSLVAERLSQYKGDQFAAIASAKCTNEENYLLQKLARAVMGSNHVDHCARL